MIDEAIGRQQVRHGKMTDPETADTDEHVLNVTFTRSDKDGNPVEGGISKDNSLLVKYFAESIRPSLIGKKKTTVWCCNWQPLSMSVERMGTGARSGTG